MPTPLTPEQRAAVKAELAQLNQTARTLWQATLDAPEWYFPDTEQAPTQVWHTRAVVRDNTESD